MQDYTGLAAIAWQLFSGEEAGADLPFFETIIRENGGAALDVGCGTGRLLLPLLAAGLDVEGVEPSEDMLRICRERAEERGLSPVLYCQSLETLDLPQKYSTIIVPCGTIQLVADREDVFRSLERLYHHLEPGGRLVLTAFNRWLEMESEEIGEWKHRATKALPDGSEVQKHAMIVSRNLTEQTLECRVRYRRYNGEDLIEEQLCHAPERWYFKHELCLLMERAGLSLEAVTGNYTFQPVSDEHYVMAFMGRKPA